MKKVIVIPARYASTRLPGKPLQQILGRPMIQWVYEAACTSLLKDEVIIATDDSRIMDAAAGFGAHAVMTSSRCRSGTDRVYEAIGGMTGGIVVNLQGDEPEVRGEMIDSLFECMEREEVEMATLCSPILDEGEYRDPNTVKVVFDKSGWALYFSRSAIPFIRNRTEGPLAYKHIGIYAYTTDFLTEFVSMGKSRLEEAESLEQLRVLDNGHRIKVLLTEYDGIGIDTAEDMARFAEKVAKTRGLK